MHHTFLKNGFLTVFLVCAFFLVKGSHLVASEPQEGVGLPKDILKLIFRQVDPYTLANVSRVCKSWHKTAKDETLWKGYLIDARFDLNAVDQKIQKQSTSFPDKILGIFFKSNQSHKSFVTSLISPDALTLFFLEYLKAHQPTDQALSTKVFPPQ